MFLFDFFCARARFRIDILVSRHYYYRSAESVRFSLFRHVNDNYNVPLWPASKEMAGKFGVALIRLGLERDDGVCIGMLRMNQIATQVKSNRRMNKAFFMSTHNTKPESTMKSNDEILWILRYQQRSKPLIQFLLLVRFSLSLISNDRNPNSTNPLFTARMDQSKHSRRFPFIATSSVLLFGFLPRSDDKASNSESVPTGTELRLFVKKKNTTETMHKKRIRACEIHLFKCRRILEFQWLALALERSDEARVY